MKIFSGTSNIDFSLKVANHLNLNLAKVKIGRFADGEINIIVEENVRKQDCYIIQPTGPSLNQTPNDNFMELLILCDALKRGSANSVNVVMPYYGYQRQDRKDYSRAPISAKVIASCLEAQNINRVIVFDLHAGQIQGFFSSKTPFDNLYVESNFIDYIKNNNFNLDKVIIISPDEGGMKRAVRVSNKLGVGMGTIYKERSEANVVNTMSLMGNVKGKICILVDDMIDTAGTATKASKLLKDKGAEEIYMFACHGIFSGKALENIYNSEFTKVIVTNTLNQDRHFEKIKELNLEEKIDIIDVSWMCAEAIRRSNYGESLKELYDSPIKNNLHK
jgi:ribose-phosphate pyrophosphokinase